MTKHEPHARKLLPPPDPEVAECACGKPPKVEGGPGVVTVICRGCERKTWAATRREAIGLWNAAMLKHETYGEVCDPGLTPDLEAKLRRYRGER